MKIAQTAGTNEWRSAMKFKLFESGELEDEVNTWLEENPDVSVMDFRLCECGDTEPWAVMGVFYD